jgi:ectoine hydroxylase-related dioxygenase (phytanoyl-CoA dioxygenase family)
MENFSVFNPQRLSPDLRAELLEPFGSWPDLGLPVGYFYNPLPPGAIEHYRRNGWLVLNEAFSRAEIDELIAHTTRISRNEDGTVNRIAPARPEETDIEVLQRVLCIHFPHKIDPVFFSALSHPAIVDTLTQIIGPNVKCMQSMLFVKAGGKPGQAWHQDEAFIPTRDRSLTGAWIALDDATVKNGCLWVLSGSHQRGLLWPQKFHFDDRFDCTRESYGLPWQDQDSIPVEVKAGSIVFFNGYLLHRSLPNRAASGFRRSLVNHYMSAESLLPWKRPEDKTAMALADYRDIVMVAGQDPFSYKGTENIATAFVRSDGQGGCADWTDEEQKALAQAHPKAAVQAAAGSATAPEARIRSSERKYARRFSISV